MSDGDRLIIPETVVAGRRLGRHVEHDPLSRGFSVNPSDAPALTKVWTTIAPLDQGQIGSCTGNGLTCVAGSAPFKRRYKRYTERQALSVYERATVLDGFPGTYLPDDTGSSGLAAAKACIERGWAETFLWAFSIDALRQHVAHDGPVAVGTAWLTGMDTPDAQGVVKAEGEVRGGHEYAIVGWHADTSLGSPAPGMFESQNSWGPSFGVRGTYGHGGRFFIAEAGLANLLASSGDAVTFAPGA